MAPLNFRRLVNIEAAPVLKKLIKALGHDVAVYDAKGHFVFGEKDGVIWTKRYDVTLEGELIGWVMGSYKTFWIAKMLCYWAEEYVTLSNIEAEIEKEHTKIQIMEEELQHVKAELARAGR